MTMKNKNVQSLPESKDEYWEGEKVPMMRQAITLCDTHGKNWKDHMGYRDNHDGTASCLYCPWGFLIPGYIRIYEGKAYDLRSAHKAVPRPQA